MAAGMCKICSKLISISKVPGGNPVALANPGLWATNYQSCSYCKRMFCEDCVSIIEEVFNGVTKCPYCYASISEEFNIPPGDLFKHTLKNSNVYIENFENFIEKYKLIKEKHEFRSNWWKKIFSRRNYI